MGNPVNMYYIGSELLTHYNANVHNFHLETNEMWNFEERFSIINQYCVFSLKCLQVIIFTKISENTDFVLTYQIPILVSPDPFEQIFF